jgi:hypothetical protein
MEEQFCFLNDEPRATTKVDRDGTSAGRSSRRSDGRVKTLALPWRAHHYIIEIIDPSLEKRMLVLWWTLGNLKPTSQGFLVAS